MAEAESRKKTELEIKSGSLLDQVLKKGFRAKTKLQKSEAAKDIEALVSEVLAGIQFGSKKVQDYSRGKGYLEVFEAAGATIIDPGCGACIGCGPGVSDREEQVTVSAINRNFKGRSGPGKMYLASPFTVAASAIDVRMRCIASGDDRASRLVNAATASSSWSSSTACQINPHAAA